MSCQQTVLPDLNHRCPSCKQRVDQAPSPAVLAARTKAVEAERSAAIDRQRLLDEAAELQNKGAISVVVGLLISGLTYAVAPGGYYLVAWGPVLWGVVNLWRAHLMTKDASVRR
ncbi:MAG: hypothetical protein ACK5ZS_00185 [bacterium]